MPELAEIHSYARNINEWVTGVTFEHINKQPTGKGPDISLTVRQPFSIFAKARGKELQLTLGHKAGGTEVTFRHGLVGIWEWVPKGKEPKHTQISFSSNSNSLW